MSRRLDRRFTHRLFACLFPAALVLAGSGCAPDSAAPSGNSPAGPALMIYAAISTRDALVALQPALERDHSFTLHFQFGSSGDLARQIEAASRADLFLSAGEREMDELAAVGLLVPGTRCDLLSNQLVVVEPGDAASIFTVPFTPVQLADARVQRLSLAHVETVPAGRYAREWLEQIALWPALQAKVLPALDVRAALAAVEAGAAQAGIVYRSDVAVARGARIVYAVPPAAGPRIRYPIALLAGRAHTQEARAVLEALQSAQARAVFERFGFLSIPVEPAAR